MEFETLVQSRRSVRGFKNKPVPRTVVEAIIDSAKRAPSSMNTQPWQVHVLTGSPLEELRRRNMEEMVGGAKVKRDIISHGEYQGVEVIMTCVAMGYPDDNFAANAVRSDREGNDEFVRYVGFADRHGEGGDYSLTKFFVRTRYGPLQSQSRRRNNTRTQGFVAGARELTCGGWLAWFDGSSVRGCGVRSMMIPVFLLLLKSSAGWSAVAGVRT